MQNVKSCIVKTFLAVVCVINILGFVFVSVSCAKTAKEIDANVDVSLERFRKEVKGADEFLKSAKGVLVLSGVVKGE